MVHVFFWATLLWQPGHMNPEFPEPAGLQSRVEFWEHVFEDWDEDTVVLFDREHPHIVYGVFEGPGLDTPTLLKESKARLHRLAFTRSPTDAVDRDFVSKLGGVLSELLVNAENRLAIQHGRAHQMKVALLRAESRLIDVEQTLLKYGVPAELAALPLIESAYDPRIHSGIGAAGLWQLMPATAKEVGLRVDNATDERLRPALATAAAAKILRKNFGLLGTWPLAITGYNHGPYGLKEAAKKLNTKDLTILIDQCKRDTWGFDSKNFYAEFLAAHRLLKKHRTMLAQKVM